MIHRAEQERTEADDAEAFASVVDNLVGDSDTTEGDRIVYRRASDIHAKPIRWLWRGRIARGKVSMLAGNPGLGKSQVTSSMAAIASTGGLWPVDRTRCERGAVVILSAEDDAEDTIRPRLEAAGADLSRVFIIDAVVEGYMANGGEMRRAFNLKTDLVRLGAMLEEIGDVALVIIDPITAYLGDTDSHKNAEIRALLAPLSDLAARHGAAVVCVSHLNKSGGSEALMRVTGSLAFVAAARAAFIVVKDQKDESRRLFLPLKNNIGNDQSGLAFTIEQHHLEGGIETSRINWGSEPVTVRADEALASSMPSEDRSATDEAADWLREILSSGPMKASEVQKQARQAGIGDKPLRGAREKIGIKPKREGFGSAGIWYWGLPLIDAQNAIDARPPGRGINGHGGHQWKPQDAQGTDTPGRDIFGGEGQLGEVKVAEDAEDGHSEETDTIEVDI